MEKQGQAHQQAEEILKVQDVSVRFGSKEVLKRIRFGVFEGEVFGIIGMSGSGKTTLLSTLIGALSPNSGDVLFRSNRILQGSKYQSVFQNQFAARNLMGFSTQRPSFYPELTVQQNMEYFAALYDLPPDLAEENIRRAIRLVGLHGFENLEARFLSGGMQKKLDIACAIIHNPSVLILDEPTADLDPITRAELLRLFKRINMDGKTIIIASHFLSELEYFCNRIAILNNGVIAEIGSVEELSSKISGNKEIHLQTAKGNYSIIIEKLKRVKVIEISQIIDKGHKLVISTPSAEHVLQHVLQAVKESEDSILNVNITRPSLSDVFRQVVKKK